MAIIRFAILLSITGCLGELRERTTNDVKARLGSSQIVLLDDRANLFGIASHGPWQLRGNGCLAITPTGLLFEMWLPHREVWIPRDHIVRTGITSSFLGKTRFHDLLEIWFRDERGAIDKIAWQVGDVQPWLDALTI